MELFKKYNRNIIFNDRDNDLSFIKTEYIPFKSVPLIRLFHRFLVDGIVYL